jgi:poly-gamma-glutamate capsule biosynthesis protein CapA/YwtB (metallophosphatase superfamily)
MNRKRRGVSFGTVFMLCMVVLTLGGSAFVLTRLSGGGTVDLARLGATLQLDGEAPKQEVDDILIREEGKTAEKKPTVTKAPAENSEKNTFTLAVGGLAAIETEVRRSCYSNDSKKYDFSDVFAALKPAFSADLSCIFLENILSDDYKVSTSVVPAAAADMLRGAGIQAACCGWSKAWEKEGAGAESTRKALEAAGIKALGLGGAGDIFEANGIQVAMLQYTGTLSAATKKSLAKNGQEAMLPEAEMETIAAGIRDARSRGAGAVVILVNWGKDGKAPDKAQKALAQQIADAGADLIIGAGSRIPQAPEVLKAAGTGREVLCVYSAGTLLSDNRKSAKRLGSYLLHVTFTGDGEGTAVSKVEYTPVYIWRYKQDGKFYYRCVAANGAAPDGMDSEQMKTMEKAVAAVSDALEGTSLTVRGAEAGR